MSIKQKLIHIIKESLPLDIQDEEINITKKDNYYSTNIAILLSQKQKKDPIKIANIIKNKINNNIIKKIEITDIAIINIYISDNYLLSNIKKIIQEERDYGKSNYGNNQKVNITYSSTNSLNKLSYNDIRAFIYGDCLSRIMTFTGYDVTRQFHILNSLSNNNSIANIKKNLDKIRINYDEFTSEKELLDKGIIDTVLTKLQRSGRCYIKNNSLWLKTNVPQNNQEEMLIQSDGNYTDILLLIAYYIDKLNKVQDINIDIFKSDSEEYINIIKSSTEILGYNFNKISKRILENVKIESDEENITIDSLVEEIPLNTIRYNLISKRFDSEITFDIKEIKQEDINNKAYYIEKVNQKVSTYLYGKKYEMVEKLSTTNYEYAYTILNKLLEFEDLVIKAATRGIPYIISNYLYDLASLADNYLKLENVTDNEKTIILKATNIVINNAANIIGLILK